MEVPGCDGVEFDVRASSDGIPVLLHDATLERVQGRPEAVGQLTADELEPLGVPRLAAVLAALPRRAFLDIELKEPFGRPLIEVLAAGRGPEMLNAVVSAFDPATIARIRDLVPGWPCWLNTRDLEAGHDRHRRGARLPGHRRRMAGHQPGGRVGGSDGGPVGRRLDRDRALGLHPPRRARRGGDLHVEDRSRTGRAARFPRAQDAPDPKSSLNQVHSGTTRWNKILRRCPPCPPARPNH